jgi:thiol-disulfide isomerase/thioredoxin
MRFRLADREESVVLLPPLCKWGKYLLFLSQGTQHDQLLTALLNDSSGNPTSTAVAFAKKIGTGTIIDNGDAAPTLQVDKWLKGEPTKKFEPGKIYVIECWATWCGPCIASMPHVTKMAAKYKDKGVIVIGVDVWERDLTKPEPRQRDGTRWDATSSWTSSGGAPGRWRARGCRRRGATASLLVSIDRTGKIA